MSKKQLSYTLFEEKYRPETVDEVVMPNIYKNAFKKMVENKEVPNLLLYSSYPGSGKTSLAKALCNDIDANFLYINASEDSGIDTIRNTIRQFASGKTLDGKKKIVILDEIDGMSPNSQKALRGFISEFHNNCRFISTCNYINKIISPLRSRFQEFDFNVNKQELIREMVPKVVARVSTILKFENIEFDKDAIKSLVEEKFPDIRKIYTILQQYSTMSGCIDKNVLSFTESDEKLYQLILTKKFTLARQHVLDNGYDLDSLYTDFYKNLIPKIEDKSKQMACIRVIGEWNYRSAFCADKEIPFATMLLEIISEL